MNLEEEDSIINIREEASTNSPTIIKVIHITIKSSHNTIEEGIKIKNITLNLIRSINQITSRDTMMLQVETERVIMSNQM